MNLIVLLLSQCAAAQDFTVFDKLVEGVELDSGEYDLNLGLLGDYTFEGLIGNLSVTSAVLSGPDAKNAVGVATVFDISVAGDLHNKHNATLQQASAEMKIDTDIALSITPPRLFSNSSVAAEVVTCELKLTLHTLSIDGIEMGGIVRYEVAREVEKKVKEKVCETTLLTAKVESMLDSLVNKAEGAITNVGEQNEVTLVKSEEADLEARLGSDTMKHFAAFSDSLVAERAADLVTDLFGASVATLNGPDALNAISSALGTPIPSTLTELGLTALNKGIWGSEEVSESSQRVSSSSSSSALPLGVKVGPQITVTHFAVKSADLMGFASVDNLVLKMYPGEAPNAVFGSIGFANLSAEVDVEIGLQNDLTGYTTTQTVSLSVDEITNFVANFTAVLLVDTSGIGNLTIENLIDVASTPECATFPLKYLRITSLFIATADIKKIAVKGSALFDEASTLLEDYLIRPILLPALPAISFEMVPLVDFFLKEEFGKYINQTTKSAKCIPSSSSGLLQATAEPEYILFNDSTTVGGKVVSLVAWGANTFLGGLPSIGPDRVLQQYSPTVNNVSRMLFEGTLDVPLVIDSNVSIDAGVGPMALGVHGIRVSGLDAVNVMQVFLPVKSNGYALKHHIVLQNLTLVTQISMKSLQPKSADVKTTHYDTILNVSISLAQFAINVTTQTKVKQTRLADMTLDGLAKAGCAASLFATQEGLAVPSFAAYLGTELLIDVDVLKEDGTPGMDALSESLRSEAGRKELTDFFNTAILSENGLIGSVLRREQMQAVIDTAIQASGAQCTGGPDPTPPTPAPTPAVPDGGQITQKQTYTLIYGLVISSGSILLLIVICGRVARKTRARNVAKYRERRASNPAQAVQNNECSSLIVDDEDEGAEGELSTRTKHRIHTGLFQRLITRYGGSEEVDPLVHHETMSDTMRYLFPLLVLLAVTVFFTGNITLGASVAASIKLAGAEVDFKNVYTYNLASTVTDTWNGNARLLAVVISITSGVWPYMKLFLLMFCWFADDIVLPAERRGTMLRIIDFLGKWSLTDNFLQAIMMVSFRFHLVPPEVWSFLPKDFLAADLEVQPDWGVYAFLTAAISTLLLNHVQIVYHRNALAFDDRYKATHNGKVLHKSDTPNDSFARRHHTSWFDIGKGDDEKRVLCMFREKSNGVFESTSSFAAIFRWSSIKSDCGVGVGVLFLLLFSTALLYWGASVESFQFEFEAIAGMVLTFFDSPNLKTSHSVLTLATAMYEEAPSGAVQHIGYGYTMVTFIIFAFMMPLIQNISLAILWAAPLTRKRQKLLFFINEIVAAWSALEVFVVALIVALLELPNFAQFMGTSMCTSMGIQGMIDATADPIGLPSKECFRVKTQLMDGCWILFASALISNATFFITWHAANSMIRKVDRSRAVEEASSTEGSSDGSDNEEKQ